MKQLVIWALIFIFAVTLTSLALMNVGQVNLRWNEWELQTSLSMVAALLVVLLLVWYVLVRGWVWLVNIPANWRKYRQIKRYQKAEKSLSQGLIAQEQADWAQAEKQLIKSAEFSQNGLVHYLSAAKMADMQQASARRDKYLDEARKRYPDEFVTIGLVEARLLMDKDSLQAGIILAELHRQQPQHRAVLSDYVKVLRLQKQAQKLAELLPLIRKHSQLSREDLAQLEAEILAMQLAQTADFEGLERLWQSLSCKQKLQPTILLEYVKRCIQAKQLNGVAEWIEKALKQQWDESLVYHYGRIQFGPAYDRLKKAQAWLKGHPGSAVLLLTLGRLACQSQLWGQAHGYLRESLRLQPEIETFHALALCYEAEGQDNQAALVYKQAMLQLDHKPPV